MRVLMLSANTGEGHNSTAKALIEVLELQGAKCEIWDTLAFLSPRFSKFICNWHVRIYRYSPKLFDFGYGALERSNPDAEKNSPIYDMLSLGAHKLWKALCATHFDAVICPHPFAGMMMTEIRRCYHYDVPCFFVATDYTCSPTAEQCDLDGYFIPSGALAEEFIRVGLEAGKLQPLGLPVRQAFYSAITKGEAREKLHLPATGKIVMLMSGSMGCGPVEKIAKELAEGVPAGTQVVVICGSNEKLYENLAPLESENVRVLGFTKQISDYMDAADLIITKPGGLSTTEAANKHLPMVLINSVGGCESRNFEYFVSRGYAIGSSDYQDVVEQTIRLLQDGETLEEMRRRMEEAFSTNGAAEIADYLRAYCATHKPTEAVAAADLPEGEAADEFLNKTADNLRLSFGEAARCRAKYTAYAEAARGEDKEWIARIFEEAAAHQAALGSRFLKELRCFEDGSSDFTIRESGTYRMGTTVENLQFAAEDALTCHDLRYPAYEELARREGYTELARLWQAAAQTKAAQYNLFYDFYAQLLSGSLWEKDLPAVWQCLGCGYAYKSSRAQEKCPVCGRALGWNRCTSAKKIRLSTKKR